MRSTASDKQQAKQISTELLDVLRRKLLVLRAKFQLSQEERHSESLRQMQSRIESAQLARYGWESYIYPEIFLERYDQIVKRTLKASEAWSTSVVEEISFTLERVKPHQPDKDAVRQLLKEFAGAEATEPWVLPFVDPRHLLGIFSQRGLKSSISKESFRTSLAHAKQSAASRVRIAAKNSANSAEAELDLYFLKGELTKKVISDYSSSSGLTDIQAEDSIKPSLSECLPNSPQKKDEWYYAIHEAVSQFFGKHRKCPNQVEVWRMLQSGSPAQYGITSGTEGGQDAVFMDGEALSKRAFNRRWKSYTSEGSTE